VNQKGVEDLLKRTGKLYGWSYRASSKHPQGCIFWFHLEEDKKIVLAFDWYRDEPHLVTPKGPHRHPLTGPRLRRINVGDPINLNHISSWGRINKFFSGAIEEAKPPKKSFFSALKEILGG